MAFKWLPATLVVACAVAALVVVYSQPFSYLVAIGVPGDRAFVEGFNARETSPAGIPFRWTTARSTVIFRAAGLAFPANRRLDFSAPLVASRPPGINAPAVTVTIGGASAGEETVAAPRVYRWQSSQLPHMATNIPVTLDSGVYSPSGDKRDLGVAVLGSATLAEAPGVGIAFPPVGAWLRWLALIGLAWLVAGVLSRHSLAPPACAIATLLVAGTVAWFYRVYFWEYMHLALLLAGVVALAGHWRRLTVRFEQLADATATRQPWALPVSVTILLGGQALLTADRAPAIGALLLFTGAITIGFVLSGARRIIGRSGPASGMEVEPTTVVLSRRREVLVVTVVAVLAAVARFYRLPDIPYGLWRDEARHGLEALQILRDPSYRPVYIPNISLPGLFPLGLAADFHLFGASVATLRGFTAAFGVASALMLYALARQLYGPSIGLLAGFLYAVGSWRVSIDRLAFDTAPTTFCTLLGFYAFVRATSDLEHGRRGVRWFGLTGVALALAVYGYYPGRFGPVAVALGLLFLWWRSGWPMARRAIPGIAVAAVVAAFALSPLAWYATLNPDAFFRRSGQVFLLAPRFLEGKTALEAIEQNLIRHAVMFNWHGEPNARHHAPGWPMLDVVTAAFFIAGLGVAVIGATRGRFRDAFSLLWLGVMLAPSVVSVDAPSAVRAQDAAPAAYLLAAIGLRQAWNVSRPTHSLRLSAARRLVGGGLLTVLAGLNLWLYFVHMPRDPRVLGKFYVAETRAGYAIAARHARDAGTVAYLPPPYLRDEVLSFVAWQTPRRALEASQVLPSGPVIIVVPRGDRFQQQLAIARAVAARSGLQEVVTRGATREEWYVEFARP